MALDGDRQWELVDEVHGSAGDDGAAAEILQAEHCGEWSERGSQMTGVKTNRRGKGSVVGEVSDGKRIRYDRGGPWRGSDHGEGGPIMGTFRVERR